jgi:hypothetical protein
LFAPGDLNTYQREDALIKQLTESDGPGSAAYESALEQLMALGEPAIERFLQVMTGEAVISCKNKHGLRAVLENRFFALMRLGQRNIGAVLAAGKIGDRAENEWVLRSIGSVQDARVDQFLLEFLDTCSESEARGIAYRFLRDSGVLPPWVCD